MTAGMNYEVRAGKEKAFEKQFARVWGALQELPGHLSTYLYRDALKARCYVVLSEWERREDFERFMASEAFRTVAAWGEANILASRPRHVLYEDGVCVSASGCCPHPEPEPSAAAAA